MVHQGSRYVNTSIYRAGGKSLVFNIRLRARFNPEKFSYHTWVQGDTIDGVAYRYYNNTHLWWAIMDANPKYIFDTDIHPGDIIIVPDYREVVRLSG